MALSGFVPQASGHPDCSIVLPQLDEDMTLARRDLIAGQKETDSQAITDAWAEFEHTVVCVDGVYRCLDSVIATVDADLTEPRSTTSTYINHIMSADAHPLAMALSALARCADKFPVLVAPGNSPPAVVAAAVLATTNALGDVMREIRTHSPEFVKPFVDCERMTASSWREHGFGSLEACDAHEFLGIPASTRNHLMTTIGARWAAVRGTDLAERGWHQVGTMPTGVRLGSAVRYVSNKQARAPLMMYEQLLVREVNSLFDKNLYMRLRAQLHDMPNAQLPSDSRIPLLAIMYSMRIQTENADADVLAAFEDGAVNSGMLTGKVKELRDGLVSTRWERAGCRACRITHFLGRSAIWYGLATRLQLGDTTALDHQAVGWSEAKRSLYYIMRTLVSMRTREQDLKLATRVLWWTRYAHRGRADENDYWLYRFDLNRLTDDMRAFTVTNGFWGSGPTWTFTPDKMNA